MDNSADISAHQAGDLFGVQEQRPSADGLQPLAFNGVVIRKRGQEMLSLTDMWKATAAHGEKPDANKAPAKWKEHESTTEFLEFIAAALNIPQQDVYKASQGKHGGTWAHWQIALAYGKYLSPEFHAWCNSVVRAHMEGALAKRQEFEPEDVYVPLMGWLKKHIRGPFTEKFEELDRRVDDLAKQGRIIEEAVTERDRSTYQRLIDIHRDVRGAVGGHKAGVLLHIDDVYKLAGLTLPIPRKGMLTNAVKQSLDSFCRRHHYGMDQFEGPGRNVDLWCRDGVLAWLEATGREIISAHMKRNSAHVREVGAASGSAA